MIDLRCSTPGQAVTSIYDQRNAAQAFVEANKLTPVGEIAQEGVTGSIPAVRTDFEQIIDRKRTLNDFDVLVVTDISRFSRVGTKHGMACEYELEVEGIEVVFVANDLPAGEDGDLIKPAYYFAARMWAKSLAYCCTRGSMSALIDGRMAHTPVAPYGLDLCYSVNGKPVHVTRLLPDGRQLKLHPDAIGKKPTEAQILAEFPANPKKQPGQRRVVNHHYRKQKNETVSLVPGDPDAVAAAIMAFTLKLSMGWGAQRIASELNGLGIPAPRGGLWNISTVDNLLRNKTYVGVGIANKTTRAIINQRSPNNPMPRQVSLRELATRKTQRLEQRPKDDWIERPYETLHMFLGPELTPLAQAFIEKELKKKEHGHIAKNASTDRHADSKYLLKHILTSKQGHHRMTGFVSHSNGRKYRRYRISPADKAPVRGSILRRKVPADRIESAVLSAVELVLQKLPDMRGRLIKSIGKEIGIKMKDNVHRKRLTAEQKDVKEEYRLLIGSIGKHGKELAKQRIAQLEAKLDSLDARMQAADAVAGSKIKPESQADRIIHTLTSGEPALRSMPPSLVRQMLSLLISKLEVDLNTLDFELELSLPSWAMIHADALDRQLRLVPNLRTQTGNETQHRNHLILQRFSCTSQGRPICFVCRRMNRAAKGHHRRRYTEKNFSEIKECGTQSSKSPSTASMSTPVTRRPIWLT